MQKICAIILLSALASNHEALPQTKWSRPIRNAQGQLVRERRQFPFGEWIPLNQACPTCRPFADPLDVGLRGENIGLTPPRPPTVTRQIHGEGNFFPPDESSILSVPPPPPRHPFPNNNGNFQFSSFGPQFNAPLPVPTQKIFPQTQQIPFLPQTLLPNQPLLVNGNQQILPGLNHQGNLFGPEPNQQQINNGKVNGFNSEFKSQKIPENVVLEQNNRQIAPKQPFSNKPQPFTPPQHNQQQNFVQQQAFGGQQQHSFGNNILTPPPAPKNASQDIVIPGLDKEEIQLLYVPVETLRQRGVAQEQLLSQQPQNVQFFNRGNGAKRPVNNVQPTEQTLVTQQKGHFVTQNGNGQGQTDTSLKVTSSPFPTSVTPSTLLLQHLPFQQTPQPFVSVTPTTPTIDPFVTPASVFQKYSSFTPETTLPHLSTVPNTIQYSQPGLEFGTTPKTLTSQGPFKEDIINGKSQFSGLKNTGFNPEQGRPFQQSFGNQQQTVTQPPQLTTLYTQDQQKELITPTHFPHQIDQQQIALQKQQEHQRLLEQQRKNELEEQRIVEQQRKQKELEEQRLIQQQQRQKELEQQRFLQKQKEIEEQRLLQQQRQKELEQQRLIQKQKELDEQRLLQRQQRQKELEQQRFLQKQKELEEQRILQQQQRLKELEQQRFLQKQKELEEQRLLQQRQKELEQQRFLQKQKELEEQRLLQEQRQKELEQQRILQEQRQKELEEQRFLQEQRQKELENQRRLQLQKQKELEEKRRIQLKQKEEEQRLLRFQQEQKELEQQRLLQQEQEFQKQKQENLKKQQQFQLFKQQQQQQQQPQQQNFQQQGFQQPNRHVLPANDQLNFIPQLEKESVPDDQELVPHQPPLSVFFKGNKGGESRITDVLRELRSSNTITVLDQYFEKMPKVFVGPAGLLAPSGYEKFELPYLSNIENNRIERRIGKLPFFVAPLNFVPPPGYAKIPFPAPHVGSVVVSSESNPAMTLKSIEKGSGEEENVSGSFPVVGPELPGLINNLNTVTTTVKPTTFASTPSLPQTTAQLRNRRPNNSLYKPQSRKPISRIRPTTTSKPEEEVTQPIQKNESSKESEGTVRKTFNRFLNRRRQQAKTTTESPLRNQQDGKSLENRFYSVEVYHKEKNQVPRTQQKSDVIQSQQNEEEQFNSQLQQQTGGIDRITPGGHGVFDVRPTPDFSQIHTGSAISSEERRPEISDYADVNLQTFEDGPLPTGSAKTITQELYRPNAVSQEEGETISKTLSKPDSSSSSVKYQPSGYEDVNTSKFPDVSDASPATGLGGYKDSVSEGKVSVEPTSAVGYEKQDVSSERSDSTEPTRNRVSFTPGPTSAPEDHQTKGFIDSNEQYTSAFAEISKPHHIPGYVDSSQRQYSNVYPTPEIGVQAPQEEQSQEFDTSSEVKPTQYTTGTSTTKFSPTQRTTGISSSKFSSTQHSTGISGSKFLPTGSSNEQYITEFEDISKSHQVSPSRISPTAPGATEEQYTTGFSVNSQVQNSAEGNRHADDQRIGSFISVQDVPSTAGSPVSPHRYFPSSTALPSQAAPTQSSTTNEYPIFVEQNPSQISSTAQALAEVTVNPSAQTYTSGSAGSLRINEETQTGEGHGQNVGDNLSNDHRLKLPNPSIVRVRTRVRGKPRGQVNFVASQSTTPVPFTRSGGESRHHENAEQETTTKTNHFREFHPVKTPKFRGVKKPAVRTTTEAPAEIEQKTPNVYTIRPPRRPFNPSTVSTKRIRRPTSPLPSAESATEAYGPSTVGQHLQPEHPDISPSGVSNDVYYEQSSLSPVKHKFRKHFGSAEQKNDVVPTYLSTAFPTTAPTLSTLAHEEYSEESNVVKEVTQTEAPVEISEKYPEWNPSESGIDVSGIVLTTARTSDQPEEQPELEEPKKAQDSKKAFDPDLEKKTGRRRVRVRVHKRPHENFETAESQNLRTVANVLVPPTTTYKPNDESSIHQLAKNADFSFGGQKLFGSRSREYFRKRLNLTQTEKVPEQQAAGPTAPEADEPAERTTESKISAFVRKAEKAHRNDFESVSNQSSESGEGTKRPKFRGFVRKIVKHGGTHKEADSESNQVPENEENEGKHESNEFHLRQPFRGGFNHTGRGNGTRHKTFVRYVKKNKVRHHETESTQNINVQEPQKEEQGFHQTTENHTPAPASQETSSSESPVTEIEDVKEQKSLEGQFPVYTTQQQETESVESQQKIENFESQQKTDSVESHQKTESLESQQQRTENVGSQQPETTEEPEVKQTLPQTTQAVTEFAETQESSSQIFQETSSNTPQPATPQTHLAGLYLTQRPKFYQTLRPVYQRTTSTGLQRIESTTVQSAQEPQEKRSGYTRFKYGKTTGFGSTGSEKLEETKKVSEQQIKNKNLHTLEVRKYLRTKNREGAFSQFSKNKYFTSEKTESIGTTANQESVESEEIATERAVRTSSTEPKTTETFVGRTDSTEGEDETTENDEEFELRISTTEAITSSEEEISEEDDAGSAEVQTTTEAEIPTTDFHTTTTATPEKATEPKIQTTESTEPQRTEYEPDIYRFSKNSFSFDETEKFTGTKNRAHVRNITTDIIENTASFSAPGVEKRPDIRVVTHRADEEFPTATESRTEVTENEKTDVEATEFNRPETTTDYPETETAPTDAVTKAKVAKILKTSTTTKVSHETEICYRGKCIRTKSENPDEDLKLLVDSASTMKIEKTKT